VCCVLHVRTTLPANHEFTSCTQSTFTSAPRWMRETLRDRGGARVPRSLITQWLRPLHGIGELVLCDEVGHVIQRQNEMRSPNPRCDAVRIAGLAALQRCRQFAQHCGQFGLCCHSGFTTGRSFPSFVSARCNWSPQSASAGSQWCWPQMPQSVLIISCEDDERLAREPRQQFKSVHPGISMSRKRTSIAEAAGLFRNSTACAGSAALQQSE